MQTFTPSPAQPAPLTSVGPLAWMRHNLFSSWLNTLTTLLIGAILIKIVPSMVDWLFLSANWQGESQAACTDEGACWVFVRAWSQQFFYGSYPDSELWRIDLSLLLLFGTVILAYKVNKGLRERLFIPLFLLLPFLSIAILDGSYLG